MLLEENYTSIMGNEFSSDSEVDSDFSEISDNELSDVINDSIEHSPSNGINSNSHSNGIKSNSYLNGIKSNLFAEKTKMENSDFEKLNEIKKDLNQASLHTYNLRSRSSCSPFKSTNGNVYFAKVTQSSELQKPSQYGGFYSSDDE